MIKKNIRLLENARKCSKTARNICCLVRKLLEIFIAWLGLVRLFLENELLENARLEFYFPCSKSPNRNGYLACFPKFSILYNLSWITSNFSAIILLMNLLLTSFQIGIIFHFLGRSYNCNLLLFIELHFSYLKLFQYSPF